MVRHDSRRFRNGTVGGPGKKHGHLMMVSAATALLALCGGSAYITAGLLANAAEAETAAEGGTSIAELFATTSVTLGDVPVPPIPEIPQMGVETFAIVGGVLAVSAVVASLIIAAKNRKKLKNMSGGAKVATATGIIITSALLATATLPLAMAADEEQPAEPTPIVDASKAQYVLNVPEAANAEYDEETGNITVPVQELSVPEESGDIAITALSFEQSDNATDVSWTGDYDGTELYDTADANADDAMTIDLETPIVMDTASSMEMNWAPGEVDDALAQELANSDLGTITYTYVPADLTVNFTLPEHAYVGDSVTIEPTYWNSDDSTWTLKKDGEDVELADYIDGELTFEGGDVSFKEAGQYELTCTATNRFEKSATCTQTINVTNSPTIDVDSNDYIHIGTDAAVTLDGTDIDGYPVEWKVEYSENVYDPADYENGSVSDDATDDGTDDATDDAAGDGTKTDDDGADADAPTKTMSVATLADDGTDGTETDATDDATDGTTGETTDDATDDVTDEEQSGEQGAIDAFEGEEVPAGDASYLTGELAETGGSQVLLKCGTYKFTATVTDEWGTTVSDSCLTIVENEAPSVPDVTATVDYNDYQNAYTPQCTIRSNVSYTATDPDGDTVTYELDPSSIKDGDYVGLGQHTVRVRAVDQWGLAGEWGEATVEVVAPSKPTIDLVSAKLGDKTVTPDGNLDFVGNVTAGSFYRLATIDYYNQSDISKQADIVKSMTSNDLAKTYADGRHILMAQVTDMFGQKAYDQAFFIVGKDNGSGSEDIGTTTTNITAPGVYDTDGRTPLAYIDSVKVNVPTISGHSSGNEDYLLIMGKYVDTDGSIKEEQVLKFNTNDATAAYDSSTSTYTSSNGTGTFEYPTDKYIELSFTFYSPHDSCMSSGSSSLSYEVHYKFILDNIDNLNDLFDQLVKW